MPRGAKPVPVTEENKDEKVLLTVHMTREEREWIRQESIKLGYKSINDYCMSGLIPHKPTRSV